MKISLVFLSALIFYSGCQSTGSSATTQSPVKEIDESNPAGETKIKNDTPLTKGKTPTDPVPPAPPAQKRKSPIKK